MSQSFLADIVQKVKEVIVKPSEFFERIAASEPTLNEAFKYYALVSLITLAGQIILSAVVNISTLQMLPWFYGSNMIEQQVTSLFMWISAGWAVTGYILGLAFTFISAAIVHLVAALLKGKGNYAASYKSVAYSSTPSLIFGWIPIVNIIALLYSIYLLIVGISKLHQMSMARAFAVIIIPGLVVMAVAVAIIILLFASGSFAS